MKSNHLVEGIEMPALFFILFLFPSFTALNGAGSPDPSVREASHSILKAYGSLSYPAYLLYSQDSRPAVQMARRQIDRDLEEKRAQIRRMAAGPAPEEWLSPAQWGQPSRDDEEDMEEMAKDGTNQ